MMDSAILSLLDAFLLSLTGLFDFIWSLRKGLSVENPSAASVISARGEVGRVDDPTLDASSRHKMQDAARSGEGHAADRTEIEDRIEADRSSAFPVFMRLTRPVRSDATAAGPSPRSTGFIRTS